jgi:hypothetical protein
MLYVCKSHVSVFPCAVTDVLYCSKLVKDCAILHSVTHLSLQLTTSTLPVMQWSHTLCTWRYPEVLLAQEQLKAKHLSGIGSPGSPDQLLRHTSVSELYSDT